MNEEAYRKWEEARLLRATAMALRSGSWQNSLALAVNELGSESVFGRVFMKLLPLAKGSVRFGDLIRAHSTHFSYYIPTMVSVGEACGQLPRALFETSRILMGEVDLSRTGQTAVGKQELWEALDFKMLSMIYTSDYPAIQVLLVMYDLTQSRFRPTWGKVGLDLTNHRDALPLVSAMERTEAFSPFVMEILRNAHYRGTSTAIRDAADDIAEEILSRYFTLGPCPHN